MNTKTSFLTAAALMALPILSWAANPTADPNTANLGGQTFNSSGIMVHDGAAYIVHRLQSEMSLPNGTKVEPNGTLIGGDGKSQTMNSGQMLTLDGQIKSAPFSADDHAPFAPGIGKDGQQSTSKFFAPSSGSFPGVNDTLGFGTPEPDSSSADDFSD